jgi:hypothetical protein
MDGDHGLAETFFKIRSGTSRKFEFVRHFFLLSIIQATESRMSDFFRH